MFTTVTGSLLLEATYVGGRHDDASFPCESIEMELNFVHPTLVVRGIASQHVVALRWTPDRVSFGLPELAQLWTFKLRAPPAAICPRAVRFELASALPFSHTTGDV
ncbi:hypothetical protein [Cupriavidus sp. CuC1]|uniref:hypothetical protein n=1 Tax=Cupriavidus sp. CuC1 TaxID=3373131 RepID=UPI0037CDD363